MANPAITVEGLSKRYRIGQREEAPNSLAGMVAGALRRPAANLRRLRRLSKFGEDRHEPADIIWALRDVSFEIAQGEVVGIVGRNGAGKTTLLKVLSRITEPTAGRVTTRGRVSSLLEVGTGFHPELTGRDNVFLNGAILGMRRTEIDRKFDDIVAFSGVERFIDTPVKRYSSGMQVRLAFAVAAHLEPEILLVDEVLAVGDAEFQKRCLGKMEDVAQEGRTVLFVSHNLSAVNRLCPRAILLDAGTVVQAGTSAQVTTAYLHGAGVLDGQRTWSPDDAPGSQELRLTSVTLANGHGSPTALASVEEPLELRIEYRVERPNLRFRCVAMFFAQGVCAFASMEPTEAVRESQGIYRSSVLIPGNLLAEGEYSVVISIFTSQGQKHRFVQGIDALAFQVFDPMTGSSARGDYAQNFAGVMRPRLDWEMVFEERLNEATPVEAPR